MDIDAMVTLDRGAIVDLQGIDLIDTGSEAVRELEVATKKCAQELETGRDKTKQLLAKYVALKDSVEHKAAQNYASGTTEDDYVVVLIDAHSHEFLNELAHSMTNGGSQAAKLLKDAIGQYLRRIGLDKHICRIDVRVYANLNSLSKDVLKERSAQSRALAPFAAGFSREEVFFDFVDVGDENIVKAKIADLFKLHARDVRCKQILFGACCSGKYLLALQTHSLCYDKVTLVQGTAMDPGMLKLGLKRVAFSKVFRSMGDPITNISGEVPASVLTSGICWAFQKECCFRKNCKFKHIRSSTETKNGKDKASGSDPAPTVSNSTVKLPTQSVPGLIPINSSGQRLDTYMSPPTEKQWSKFTIRYTTKKLCYDFCLSHSCAQEEACKFDHSPLGADEHYCLQYVRREWPCLQKGKCRRLDCHNGHVCQKAACKNGKVKTCRMAVIAHTMDRELVKWVGPDDNAGGLDESSRASMEGFGTPEGDLIML